MYPNSLLSLRTKVSLEKRRFMQRTKLVKVPRPLYELASTLTAEMCVTIGPALEILCVQKHQESEITALMQQK